MTNWGDHHASVTVFGNVATMTSDSLPGNVRAAAAGKVYAEVEINDPSGYGAVLVGACLPGFDVTSDDPWGNSRGSTVFFWCNQQANDIPAGDIGLSSGERARVALDCQGGKGWIGTAAGWATGDPATGADPAFTFTPGEVYFFASGYAFSGQTPGPAVATLYGHGETQHGCPDGFAEVGAPVAEPVATLVLQSGYSASVDGNVVSITKD